jgi:coenzyme F420 biosynthesis associated uncharacterized protein
VSIDYELAESSGVRIAQLAPIKGNASAADISNVVSILREAASAAVEPVRSATGLTASETSQVLVVDRASWVRANVSSLQALLDPLIEKLPESHAAGLAGLEAGALLGFLSSKVLGQYDVFGGDRLLLVAPNIWSVSKQLDVELQPFAQWVALHEETHRAQLTAVPWLRHHMQAQINELADRFEPQELVQALIRVAGAVIDAATGRPGPSLAEALQTPGQKEILDRLVGIMALLEGHADVTMDEVGREQMPEVEQIRQRFNLRRDRVGNPLEEFIKRLIGLDAKIRQYREGAAFVRQVRSEAGDEAFAAVWQSPENLPTASEIAMPSQWIRRVHG